MSKHEELVILKNFPSHWMGSDWKQWELKIPEAMERAHRHSYHNREEIERSTVCVCFYCRENFQPREITTWVDQKIRIKHPWEGEVVREGMTAVCPKCMVDSVIGDASGVTFDEVFIHRMSDFWFENHEPMQPSRSVHEDLT